LRAQEALDISEAEMIMFTPAVSSEVSDAWGLYSFQNQGWIKDGLAVQGLGDVDPGLVTPAIHSFAPLREKETYAPLWQYAPAPTDAKLVNLDMFESFPWYERLAKGVQEGRHVLLSEEVNMTTLVPGHRIRSVSVHPVFKSFEENAPILGFLSAVIPWDHHFSNVLPAGTRRLDVEVEDTCGSAFTYTVEGPSVSFLGYGLLHDRKYDSLSIHSDFADFASLKGTGAVLNGTSSCDYTISVFATDEFKSAYESEKPVLYTIAVVLVFFFTAVVFLIYDWLVSRRQNKIMGIAKQTTEIVSSLFPKNVQQRILAEAESKVRGKDFQTSQNAEFNKSLDKDCDAKKETIKLYSGKPIADLFPQTTVFFADIVGFSKS
jgi:hypothetical protein